MTAAAQITTGNVIGIVHDESGGVLPGATVTVLAPALPPQSTVTNERGEYRFTGLQPGMKHKVVLRFDNDRFFKLYVDLLTRPVPVQIRGTK